MRVAPHIRSSRGSCYCCGGVGHSSDSCYHKGQQMWREGHLARVCRSKTRGSKAGKGTGKGAGKGTGRVMHIMGAYEENTTHQLTR